jgi:flagellar M-ring protein FliF
MDFVNKAWTQLSELFRSMTPGGRVVAGLLLVGVVVSVGYLFRSEVSGCDDYLLSGTSIDPNCLPAIEAAFGKANLSGYQIDGTRIRVPRGQKASYMAALAESKALPPDFSDYFKGAVDTGPFESKDQREQRMRIALQEELALTIRNMHGIERASVIISCETKPGLVAEAVKTASVAVKPLGGEQLSESQVSSIRYLVKGAVAGMKPENVTVADLNGRVHHAPGDLDEAGGNELYADIAHNYERDLKAKVLNSLAFIPKVTVEATVVLNSERLKRTTSVDYKPKATTTEVTDKSKTRTRESAGPGGRPGMQNQGANMPTSLAATGGSRSPHEEEEESDHHEASVASGEKVETENVGLTPKLVKVSVGIPSSYFEKVWQERNPVKEGEQPKSPDAAALEQLRTEESAKLQKHVAALLPPAENVADAGELVTITTFQDIKTEPPPLPGAGQRAMSWFGQYANTLGLGALAVVSLLMLRSMVRGGVPATPTPSSPVALRIAGEEQPAGEQESLEKVAARRLRRFSGSGPTLRDELSELVQEDPDAAANILRAWIGHTN